MIDLGYLQRQRQRLYKNELKRQFLKNQQIKKNQSMQIKSKDKQYINQKNNIIKQQLTKQKIKDYLYKTQIKLDNQLLANIKNQNNLNQQKNAQNIPLKGNSFIQKLQNYQNQRSQKNKQTAKNIFKTNHQQENITKFYNKEAKQIQFIEEQKHMERLKELQLMRKQQYEAIKTKHGAQDKNLFEIHKKLQQINDQYKKSLQKFAYEGKDILDCLKRDDSKILYQKRKSMNSQLLNQMEQRKIKGQYQKSNSLQKQDLKNSIFGYILFKNQNRDKKAYADYLMSQMQNTDFRKSLQKSQIKQKVQIGSIFGGQTGPQRLKMMKYIDRTLGIESEMMKKVQPADRMNSSFRIRNLYQHNDEYLINSMVLDKTNSARSNKLNENPQIEYSEKNKGVKQNNVNEGNFQEKPKSNSSLSSKAPTKSYLSYDFIKGSPKRYQF